LVLVEQLVLLEAVLPQERAVIQVFLLLPLLVVGGVVMRLRQLLVVLVVAHKTKVLVVLVRQIRVLQEVLVERLLPMMPPLVAVEQALLVKMLTQ
jgi:hypothetical protein